MIDKETELDSALTRLVDAEDRIDELNLAIGEKDDAIEALMVRHDRDTGEIASLTIRNAELERQLATRIPSQGGGWSTQVSGIPDHPLNSADRSAGSAG